jgi:hypothetical protein
MIWGFLISFTLLCIYSFTRVDLNLTLYNFKLITPYLNYLKQLGYYNRTISTLIYLILIILIFFFYFKLIANLSLFKNKLKYTLIFTSILGMIAYPMFSHDIFNYLFNAKMILVYQSNPHLHTALEFASDSWTRFMHNTHTAAPYGHAWTLISLIPVYLGLPNFTLSLWFTKTLITIFFFLEIYIFSRLAKVIFPKDFLKRTLTLALNPLILIETLIMGHNDSLMMFFIFLSFYLLEINSNIKNKVKNKILSCISFFASVSVKYATIVLAPILIFKHKIKDIYSVSGLILLLILLSRPGQLNSWYLHWGISFLLLSKNKRLTTLGILLSIGGLLRYAPFIYYGHWSFPVTIQRWVLLILPVVFIIPITTIYEKITKK